mmetsp:Transcript_62200/g.196838  ORF Transcript_62200/g.196838 Transcript_62200/m.196838 type:complete len:133 (+) Transcript_62200:91-489(+)
MNMARSARAVRGGGWQAGGVQGEMGPTEDPVLCSLGELEARDNLPRVPHAAVEAFQYSTPCIITGATRSWKVPVAEGPGEGTGWSPEGLVARHGAQDFEVSLPGNGAARWTMARYLDYCGRRWSRRDPRTKR